jgi:hypothetical protein
MSRGGSRSGRLLVPIGALLVVALPAAACANLIGVEGVSFADAEADGLAPDVQRPGDSAGFVDVGDGGVDSGDAVESGEDARMADAPPPDSAAGEAGDAPMDTASTTADATLDSSQDAVAADAMASCNTCVRDGAYTGCTVSSTGPVCTYAPTASFAGLSCPAGVVCEIECSSANTCGADTCSGPGTCTFECNELASCYGATCTATVCNFNCMVPSACKNLSCNQNGMGCCVGCVGGSCLASPELCSGNCNVQDTVCM